MLRFELVMGKKSNNSGVIGRSKEIRKYKRNTIFPDEKKKTK